MGYETRSHGVPKVSMFSQKPKTALIDTISLPEKEQNSET